MTTEIKEIIIGTINNAYGHLWLRRVDKDCYQWGIENWNGTEWENIPLYLAKALIKFEEQHKEKQNE